MSEEARQLRPYRDAAKESFPRLPPPRFDECWSNFVECVFFRVGGGGVSGRPNFSSERYPAARDVCLEVYEECLRGGGGGPTGPFGPPTLVP
jgi:hypothetical protein